MIYRPAFLARLPRQLSRAEAAANRLQAQREKSREITAQRLREIAAASAK